MDPTWICCRGAAVIADYPTVLTCLRCHQPIRSLKRRRIGYCGRPICVHAGGNTTGPRKYGYYRLMCRSASGFVYRVAGGSLVYLFRLRHRTSQHSIRGRCWIEYSCEPAVIR